LLTGLLRCRRCGRLLEVGYSGSSPQASRYLCRGWPKAHPGRPVIVGGRRAEAIVIEQLLEAVSGNAIEAALQAAEQERSQQSEHRRALQLGLDQARYQARLAERRYEAVDPEQRWVASELEARGMWLWRRYGKPRGSALHSIKRWPNGRFPIQNYC